MPVSEGDPAERTQRRASQPSQNPSPGSAVRAALPCPKRYTHDQRAACAREPHDAQGSPSYRTYRSGSPGTESHRGLRCGYPMPAWSHGQVECRPFGIPGNAAGRHCLPTAEEMLNRLVWCYHERLCALIEPQNALQRMALRPRSDFQLRSEPGSSVNDCKFCREPTGPRIAAHACFVEKSLDQFGGPSRMGLGI